MTALTLGAMADAQNAIKRLYGVFEAETLTESKVQDIQMDAAITVIDGDFTWDSPPLEVASSKQGKKSSVAQSSQSGNPDIKEKVFQLKGINISISQGYLTAIVGQLHCNLFSPLDFIYIYLGPVGTGKTSLLEAIIGEMRKTAGTVRFASCHRYVWIH